MGSTSVGLLVTAVISAIGSILLRERGREKLYVIAKPLTTGLIFLAAILELRSGIRPGSYFFLLAFPFCIAGDILLLSPNRFVGGLVAFLFAHVCFIAAFMGITSAVHPLAFLAYLAAGGILFTYLLPDLGSLRIPVSIYVTVILVMGWRAAEVLVGSWPSVAGVQIFAGSLLFILSDFLIAVRKFKKPIWHNDAVVLATYYSSLIFFTAGFSGF